jgi:hypothetical protein|nr:MAG TPA: hypothetical protein [Caudoviricetes sp.]
MLTTSQGSVLIPSDFKIEITGITDSEGKPQDIPSAKYYFEFYVGHDGPYIVSNAQNGILDRGKLYFVFENYPFKTAGTLRYKQLTQVPDTAFSDGLCDIWTEGETNISLTV